MIRKNDKASFFLNKYANKIKSGKYSWAWKIRQILSLVKNCKPLKKSTKLNFKPKKSGEFDFAILNSFGKETTKFVNEKTEVIYPKVNKIKLTVN